MSVSIGITFGNIHNKREFAIKEYYIQAVEEAGGLAILLPPQTIKASLSFLEESLDGLILSGGGDIDPVFFGEEPKPGLGRIDPFRDEYEIALATAALKKGIPTLGICRGIQIMNVACGGTITQDINMSLKHEQEGPDWYPTHYVNLEEENILRELFAQEQIRVNSFHHQAVDSLGKGLKVIGKSNDGIIEAVCHDNHPFFLGVQWHPERMYRKLAEQKGIFIKLIKKAEKSNN